MKASHCWKLELLLSYRLEIYSVGGMFDVVVMTLLKYYEYWPDENFNILIYLNHRVLVLEKEFVY